MAPEVTGRLVRGALVLLAVAPGRVGAQAAARLDPVVEAIRVEAMTRSQLEPMAHALLDSIGPRLTGSPGMERAQAWAVDLLESWGVDARAEQYGTWEGWERGIGHVDLLSPRPRALEGRLLAWSAGTDGEPVEGPVVALPALASATEWRSFLASVRGKWVMLSFPQPTCRPDAQWADAAPADEAARMVRARRDAEVAWVESLRIAAPGGSLVALHAAIERAGAAGIVTSDWQGTYGTTRVQAAHNRGTPTFELSCEDYGLVYRLAASGQAPVVRVTSDAEHLGEVPVYNVVGEVHGTELPDEYVLLSAHLDSWDGATGATDNGSGVLMMLETMRVLRESYPAPKRSIVIGLWSGEELGLLGSRAFAADHPELVRGLQAVWNRDSGTGRVTHVSAHGFATGGATLSRWLSVVPPELTRDFVLEAPGDPFGTGSDYAAFLCRGAPGFNLGPQSWAYATHTWHSMRDSYDKLIFDELRENVVLTAALAYAASEDPAFFDRTPVSPLIGRDGAPASWPTCPPTPREPPTAR